MQSLFRIPFVASVIWATSITLTPPHRPPSEQERVKVDIFDTYIFPLALPVLVKSASYAAGIAEILVALAGVRPSSTVTDWILSHLNHSPSFFQHNPYTTPSFLLAWTCAILGALIRIWCYNVLGEMFTFELSIRKKHRLIVTGPYAIVRHPSYTGATLSAVGAFGCYTLPGSYIREEYSAIFPIQLSRNSLLGIWLSAALFGFIALKHRIQQEDEMLQREFGSEWDEWSRKVPCRLIPGVY